MRLVKFAGMTGLLGLLLFGLSPQISGVEPTESQLTQTIMFERDLQERLRVALSNLLAPVRFIVEVDAQLEFSPQVRRETVYKKLEMPELPLPGGVAERDTLEGLEEVLPGFPSIPMEEEEEAEVPVPKEQPGVISQTISSTTSPPPTVSKLDITVVLEDGVPVERIEQVRDLVSVIAHLDPDRGDQMRVLTAPFGKEVAEAAPTEKGPKEGVEVTEATAQVEGPMGLLPLPWLIALALGVVLVVLLFVVLMRLAKRPAPGPEEVKVVMPEPTPEEVPAQPSGVEREVLRSELKAARQAAVTLMVGNPEVATSVIQDWVTQEEEGGE